MVKYNQKSINVNLSLHVPFFRIEYKINRGSPFQVTLPEIPFKHRNNLNAAAKICGKTHQ